MWTCWSAFMNIHAMEEQTPLNVEMITQLDAWKSKILCGNKLWMLVTYFTELYSRKSGGGGPWCLPTPTLVTTSFQSLSKIGFRTTTNINQKSLSVCQLLLAILQKSFVHNHWTFDQALGHYFYKYCLCVFNFWSTDLIALTWQRAWSIVF